MSSHCRLGTLVTLAVMLGACGPGAQRQPGDGLPFYDDADLTPRWTETVAHSIGDFSLVTQTGAPLTRRDLEGRIHVASFIFASCDEVCPLLVSRLATVQAAVADRDDVLLVSYSVAPLHDSVDRLAAFGAEREIEADRWKLVTGDPDTIYRLARDSYFADDGRLETGRSAAELFLHTEKVLLVDAKGRLRGVYNGSMPFEMEKLLADIQLLSGDS